MLIENKVQIEAIKTRDYFAKERNGIVYIGNGIFVVFIKSKDFFLDVDKQREFEIEKNNWIWVENIENNKRKAKLSNRILINGTKNLRGVVDEESGKYFWFDKKYLDLFKYCKVFLFKTFEEQEFLCAGFERNGETVGILLPTMTHGEWGEKE